MCPTQTVLEAMPTRLETPCERGSAALWAPVRTGEHVVPSTLKGKGAEGPQAGPLLRQTQPTEAAHTGDSSDRKARGLEPDTLTRRWWEA